MKRTKYILKLKGSSVNVMYLECVKDCTFIWYINKEQDLTMPLNVYNCYT